MNELQRKKEYMERFRILKMKIRYQMDQMKEYEEMAVRITPLLEGISVKRGHNIHKLEQCLERIEEERAKCQQNIEAYIAMQHEIEAAVHLLKDERMRLILLYRYIIGKTWEEISRELEYDERWLRRLRDKALAELEV